MEPLSVRLFGRFQSKRGERELSGLTGSKAQELLCYLLIHKGRSLTREAVAGLLWGDVSTAQSKKYLRQVLWHLSASLNSDPGSGPIDVLMTSPECVSINPDADIWIDVAEFEQACAGALGVSGQCLNEEAARSLESAAGLYRGDLLEGWYQDWCVFERERLQNMLLGIIDKLMVYYESCGDFERGISHGNRALGFDLAREHTHRRLMRMHYLSGDRTRALRQYGSCVRALDQELGVGPASRTTALYEQIRTDELAASLPGGGAVAEKGSPAEIARGPEAQSATGSTDASEALPDVLTRLQRISSAILDLQRSIGRDIKAVEMTLKKR